MVRLQCQESDSSRDENLKSSRDENRFFLFKVRGVTTSADGLRPPWSS